jgi:hypothetical protein
MRIPRSSGEGAFNRNHSPGDVKHISRHVAQLAAIDRFVQPGRTKPGPCVTLEEIDQSRQRPGPAR